MSQMMTSGGWRRRGLRRRSAGGPPERSEARKVARMSMRRPWGSGREAPGGQIHDGERHPLHQPLGLLQLLDGHLLEIRLLQQLAVGEGHGRVELDLFLFRLLILVAAVALGGPHRLGQAPADLLALLLALGHADAGQQHGHHALQQLGIAPEDMEGLVEDRPLILAVDEDRMQRPVEIVAALDAHGLHRPQRLDHPARPDGQPRGPQGAGEEHEVLEEPAGHRR